MIKYLPPTCIIPVGFMLGIIFWIVDSLIDTFIFESEGSFLEDLLHPEPTEYWMRLFVFILLIIFSLIIKGTLSRERELNKTLQKNKLELEEIVRIRTEQLEKLATTDDLTQTLNRRKFHEVLDNETVFFKRYETELSLLLIDIDHFKSINDQYGHYVGDKVLQIFSELIKSRIRKSDYLARIGGEEFAVILPQANAEHAIKIAEKIRNTICNYSFEEAGKVTVSIGIGEMRNQETTPELFRRTDEALYKAKHQGRNCCRLSNIKE